MHKRRNWTLSSMYVRSICSITTFLGDAQNGFESEKSHAAPTQRSVEERDSSGVKTKSLSYAALFWLKNDTLRDIFLKNLPSMY